MVVYFSWLVVPVGRGGLRIYCQNAVLHRTGTAYVQLVHKLNFSEALHVASSAQIRALIMACRYFVVVLRATVPC